MLLASFAGVRNVRTLCFTSSVLPAYRLGCDSAFGLQMSLYCLWPRASALASSAWRCWSRLVSLCSPDGRLPRRY